MDKSFLSIALVLVLAGTIFSFILTPVVINLSYTQQSINQSTITSGYTSAFPLYVIILTIIFVGLLFSAYLIYSKNVKFKLLAPIFLIILIIFFGFESYALYQTELTSTEIVVLGLVGLAI